MNCLWTALVVASLYTLAGASPSLKDDCLQIHNKFRSKHQSPEVKWSEFLAEKAHNWSIYLAGINALKHEYPGPSDNIYMSYGKVPDTPCTKATSAFYSEVRFYDYDKPLDKWKSTGHFTQVVWKDTTEIGAGYKEFVVKNAKNKTFTKYVLVVKYRPGGNVMHEKTFKKNVLPPIEDAAQTTGISCALVLGAVILSLTNIYRA